MIGLGQHVGPPMNLPGGVDYTGFDLASIPEAVTVDSSCHVAYEQSLCHASSTHRIVAAQTKILQNH